MIRVVVRHDWAVDCRAEVDLPLAAISVWGQLRDFRRYAATEFFHHNLRIEGEIPRAGAKLEMLHRMAIFGVQRQGRILVWREGERFSFSDLSTRGCRHGFPHVTSFRVAPGDATRSRLSIQVRGRWTARWLPRWVARLWLRWVFRFMVNTAEIHLLEFAAWRRLRSPERLR